MKPPLESLSPPDGLQAGRPMDDHDRTLQSNVHPPEWVNPEPSGRYNLVVIGAGTAGLVAAAGAAGLGAKVALVERHLLGGDCLNYGCVPSKALIRCARAYAETRDAGAFGVVVPGGVRVDFAAVLDRMRGLRARISRNDSAQRFRGLGVDVFFGDARFAGRDEVEVGGKRLRFSRAVVATGARAAAPPIPGLAAAGYLTNETVFSLRALPPRLAVIGGGPIGCELAQSFARFGSEVCLIEKDLQILTREDRDAARVIESALERDGVRLLCGSDILEVKNGSAKRLVLSREGKPLEIPVDEILVGVGRAPNVEGLDLEAAGVACDRRSGVKVDDFLRTTNRRIYAAGDVCSPYRFTHMADALARIAIQNALFFRSARASALTIPWCTYTDPEIAHVGLYAKDAEARGIPVETLTVPLAEVDRAVLDGEDFGFLKVHLKRGTDRVLGATLVARHAGEMISEITTLMVSGRGLRRLSRTIHPYPTQAEVLKKAADAYNRSRLTAPARKLLHAWFAWRR
ncbi:MAG: mercuric reductase [Planctomycetes bacterium]|nr:mercuric reductase [Planctomycetota bacterium]